MRLVDAGTLEIGLAWQTQACGLAVYFVFDKKTIVYGREGIPEPSCDVRRKEAYGYIQSRDISESAFVWIRRKRRHVASRNILFYIVRELGILNLVP